MPGVTGREVTAAYGRTNTWGTADAVTQQILLQSLDGFDAEPVFIDDDSFSQTWRGPSEISDTTPRSQELTMQARYEDMDVWYAAGVGWSSHPIVAEIFAAPGDYVKGQSGDIGPVNTLASAYGVTSVALAEVGTASQGYMMQTATTAGAPTATNITALSNAVTTLANANNTLVKHNADATTKQPIAWTHQINMAPDLTHVLTLAANVDVPGVGLADNAQDTARYILQVTSLKVRGWMLRIGENGVLQASFPVVGNDADYIPANKAINTTLGDDNYNPLNRSTIKAASPARLGNRLLRKNMKFRMKPQTASGALGTEDEMTGVYGPVREISFDFTRPLAEDDYAVGQSFVIEPDDDGFAELPVEITFGRMHAKSANSMQRGLLTNAVFKADAVWTGPLINSTTPRKFTIGIPALQIIGWRAPITGQQQVRPIAMFKMRKSDVDLSSVDGFAKYEADTPARFLLTNANKDRLSSTANYFKVFND